MLKRCYIINNCIQSIALLYDFQNMNYTTSKILLIPTNLTVIYINLRIFEQTCIFLWDFPRKKTWRRNFVSPKNEPLSRLTDYPEVYGNFLSLAPQISGHCLKFGQRPLPPTSSPFHFSLILPFKAKRSKPVFLNLCETAAPVNSFFHKTRARPQQIYS